MKWDDANKMMVEADVEDGALLMPDESELETYNDGGWVKKLLPGGTYIVNRDMTLTEVISLRGDVSIILCDGVTLSMNGQISGSQKVEGTSNTYQYHPLSIYGQSGNSGKLVCTHIISSVEPLNIYGGFLDLIFNNSEGGVIEKAVGMNVYGGIVNAVNTGGTGIRLDPGTKLTIYGGKVIAKGSTTDSGKPGCGISNFYYYTVTPATTLNNAYVEVNGGSLVAISQNNTLGSHGIRGHLTVNGGNVEIKDIDPTTGEIGAASRAAVSGDITVGTGVNIEGKTSDTDWADITDNTADPKKQHIRTKP